MVSPQPLGDSWLRVSTWLREHAPGSYGTLLSVEVGGADAVEAHLGYELPPSFREWWSVVPGTQPIGAGAMLPGDFRLLPASDSIELSQGWRKIAEDQQAHDLDIRTASEAQAAGGMSWAWLPAFVPIAEDLSGNCLFVDLRTGEQTGCVKEYCHEEGALRPPSWRGVTALMEDLAAALEHGTRCGRWTPLITEEPTLSWEFQS
jgi:cell wall assembly regulator SMI1